MLFQTFDNKNKCKLIYRNEAFQEQVSPSCTKTWSYAPYLKSHDHVSYAQLYTKNGKMEEFCHGNLQKDWDEIQNLIKGVFRSSQEARLNIDEYCLYDFIPRHLLKQWAEIKNKICEVIFKNHAKPNNYNHLFKINKVIGDIEQQRLNLDLSKLLRLTIQDKNTYKLISQNEPIIKYDMFKTVTGRLSTQKGSFPIMTLAKKYRNILIPSNDWLFEMDFNACELRTVLALLGHKQPEEDLHDWNLKYVFKRTKNRDNAKKRIFSWLYNPRATDATICRIYDREKLKTLYFKDNKVITPYGRHIECDEDHAVNYLVQSTAADVLFEQMHKVWEFLENKKSFIKFCNHDSIMIDLHSAEEYEFNEIKNLFSDTRFGQFKVNCLGGKNWAEMKTLYIK